MLLRYSNLNYFVLEILLCLVEELIDVIRIERLSSLSPPLITLFYFFVHLPNMCTFSCILLLLCLNVALLYILSVPNEAPPSLYFFFALGLFLSLFFSSSPARKAFLSSSCCFAMAPTNPSSFR